VWSIAASHHVRRRTAEAGMRRTAAVVKHHVALRLATGSVVLWTRNWK